MIRSKLVGYGCRLVRFHQIHYILTRLIENFDLYRNLKKGILRGYRWISDNYQQGDRIFLFGNVLFIT